MTEGHQEVWQLIRKFVLFGLLFTCSFTFAQSTQAAEGGALSLWAGAEASTFNPDWGCKSSSPFSCWDRQLQGIAAFADLNRLLGPVGMEAEGRWLVWRGPSGINETNYLFGPRVQVLRRRKAAVDLKVLAGVSIFHQPKSWGGWAAFAPGVTFGYRVSSRWIVRGDYEFQFWPGFVGSSGHAHGLTPNGFSVGV